MAAAGIPDPAGLEVAGIPDPAGLEVAEPATTYPLKRPSDSAVEKEVYGTVAVAQPKFTSTPGEGNPQRRRLWIVGIIAVALVVLGTILGAILGTQLHHTAPDASTTTPSPRPSPTAIRHNSALAVTGWRNGADFSIRLFYQGDDGNLRVSAFESTTQSWGSPTLFVKARSGTPLAASSFNIAAFFSGSDNSVICQYQL
jgi:hypothetical protein